MQEDLSSFPPVPTNSFTQPPLNCLDVLAHHGNHEVEKTHGFDESETQNGVGEELTTESGVAGGTLEESGEHNTDTDGGTLIRTCQRCDI